MKINTYFAESDDDRVPVLVQTRVLGERQIGVLSVQLIRDFDAVLAFVRSCKLCKAGEPRADARVVVTVIRVSATQLPRIQRG
jgi:hypothetical protein